ncbi:MULTISPECIES: hypothetical protein [Kitasatospora]|uniref:Secreted protein n=1 Tax=Kitasatospora setae (strain ATCC 33774 / DSM 43861 / JCM 3304 / KCC A-0304 / NBRC 14216 / KM-6054) TaxID=452652 RepID=E4N4A2_KITSK|nr:MULTISPECIES: hypothetical protein [Kitasatospora]BAJ26033.1 hypothetical protein KSE_01820 [Kitasatospora setae KM-6054]
MIKPLAVLAGAAALSATLTVPAVATTTDTPQTTTACGGWALQGGLATQICAERTGDQVRLYGTLGLAGPPSPGTPLPYRKDVIITLTGTTPSGSVNQYITFTGSNQQVGNIIGSVPCDAAIQGTYSVSSFDLGPHPVTINTVIPC